MEEAEHIAQVTTVDHRLEVVDLLISIEKIKQVFNLLQGVLRRETTFLVLLRHALNHLTRVSTTSCLLELLNNSLLVLTL